MNSKAQQFVMRSWLIYNLWLTVYVNGYLILASLYILNIKNKTVERVQEPTAREGGEGPERV